MENANWEFLVQIGILISLVILIWRVGGVAIMVENHFEQDHEYQRDILQTTAEQPTWVQIYALMKDR